MALASPKKQANVSVSRESDLNSTNCCLTYKIKIYVIDPKILETIVQRRPNIFWRMFGIPQFARDLISSQHHHQNKKLFAGNIQTSPLAELLML